MKISTGLLYGVFLLIAIMAIIYFFMKAPKMSMTDRYNSLGNHGIQQTATGKNYAYHPNAGLGTSDYDIIPNSINYPKSDVVNPPNLLARRRVEMARNWNA